MRSFALLSAFALVGCAGNSLPIEGGTSSTSSTTGANTGTNGNNTGTNGTSTGTNGTSTGTNGTSTGTNGNNTGTTGSTTAANTGTNGSNTGTTGGGKGTKCSSTCDCATGLACFQNQCTNGMLMGVTLYCCDNTASCPDGQFCQSEDGSFGMCGSSTGGTTGGNGCTTACDCPSGEACFQGGCITPPQGKLYCCDDANACPSGGVCQSSSGGLMMCGGGANTGANGGMNGGMNGGTNGSAIMCLTTKCMSNTDCTNAGCGNCNMNRHTCRAM